jgi:hypothetical protein
VIRNRSSQSPRRYHVLGAPRDLNCTCTGRGVRPIISPLSRISVLEVQDSLPLWPAALHELTYHHPTMQNPMQRIPMVPSCGPRSRSLFFERISPSRRAMRRMSDEIDTSGLPLSLSETLLFNLQVGHRRSSRI